MTDREPRPHLLKCWPDFFEGILSGAKTFELRRDDRSFEVGDTLTLQCWDPRSASYASRNPVTRRVSYVLRGTEHGLQDGYVCLGLAGGPELTLDERGNAALACKVVSDDQSDLGNAAAAMFWNALAETLLGDDVRPAFLRRAVEEMSKR